MDEYKKTITFPDGKEYFVLDRLSIDNVMYFYLADCKDVEQIVVRKMVGDQGNLYLSQLDNDEEFDIAMQEFIKKNENNLV